MSLHIAVLYPEALTACGDAANATALVARAAQRHIPTTVSVVQGAAPLVDADLYMLGGMGARGRVGALAEVLRAGHLDQRIADGATLFAVNAALDALGHGVVAHSKHAESALTDAHDVPLLTRGLGVIHGYSVEQRETGGDAVVRPRTGPGTTVYNGWAAQRMRLYLAASEHPWSMYDIGPQGIGDTWLGNPSMLVDGVCAPHLLGTRLHGPVLARNPECADAVLAMALRQDVTAWEPLPPTPAQQGRDARVHELRDAQRAASSMRGKARALAAQWSASTVGWMRRR